MGRRGNSCQNLLGNRVLDGIVARYLGTTASCFCLAFFAPLVDLGFWNAVTKATFYPGSCSHSIDPVHNFGFGGDIYLAPFPSSNPRIKGDISDREIVATDPWVGA